jgi:hypothetical protein
LQFCSENRKQNTKMRKQITETGVKLWLSANETWQWANSEGERWPCSQLAGSRLFAEFDRNGLCDLAIDGKSGDCDANEFSAIASDFLRGKLPENHPCYFVAVREMGRTIGVERRAGPKRVSAMENSRNADRAN